MTEVMQAKSCFVAGLLGPDEVPAATPNAASKAVKQEDAKGPVEMPSKAAAPTAKPASVEEARKVCNLSQQHMLS